MFFLSGPFRIVSRMAVDAILFVAALGLAQSLRFDFRHFVFHFDEILPLVPMFVTVKLCLYWAFKSYRGMWRYTGLHDIWNLLCATCIASMMLVVMTLYWWGYGYSRTVFLLDALLGFLFTAGLRVGVRTFFDLKRQYQEEGRLQPFFIKPKRNRKEVVILGTGTAGEHLVRDIQKNRKHRIHIVGILDDDTVKMGRTIHGVPVLGGIGLLSRIHENSPLDEVYVAIPMASGTQMRRIVNICDEAGVTLKTLPGVAEHVGNRVHLDSLRDVNFEDLLGREPVNLEVEQIRESLAGKTVLVTGCGGSIGSELVRKVIAYHPARVLLLDISEFNLYSIQTELRLTHKFKAFVPILANVQDRAILDRVFSRHRPDIVFHAAAYKHVPMLEQNPWVAVSNNIMATMSLLQTATTYEIKTFVLVSTDKAVRPSSVMGASKRMTELLLQAWKPSVGSYLGVRFGNVLGSSGSVVPLFLEQIASGGPVTVTHPDVTRYFMSISEAAQLILQAGSMQEEGDIFVLKMGSPVRIADMAADLIRLAGKEPGRDIDITYVGLREGEKLYEELITHGEDVTSTTHEKIMKLKVDNDWLGHGSQQAMRAWLEGEVAELERLAAAYDADGIRRKLMSMLPGEYTPLNTPSSCSL
ncbi:polysaccharide biosynthesis protein [Desulfovibrio inopinatus]|uniref:polysaccharide biosynthesis protein n=1 Tax=Desulfovibrio inopinatus TaxID=102109 RepID=UPI00040B1500|nr:nucleoside-diphosphate sugar epimerase/dehydratase [Desulfovibrio inopinatus]